MFVCCLLFQLILPKCQSATDLRPSVLQNKQWGPFG